MEKQLLKTKEKNETKKIHIEMQKNQISESKRRRRIKKSLKNLTRKYIKASDKLMFWRLLTISAT